MSTATRACGCDAMTSSDGFKPLSVEIEFCNVDPAVLDILTGGPLSEPVFSVEVFHPIKRTFWQWLRRKPKRYQHVIIPRARIEEGP